MRRDRQFRERSRDTADHGEPHCLVVDDEPRLRQVLVHLMRSDGSAASKPANGVEALDVLSASR